ncbi:MAG TPA: biotin--[acetyl-CoA-carboxylase] ligase, partial [Actinomycetota bacterium]|nr:biotin--[acetyl-CoA-carboxylase] ligase [Actinomycetota bacterium]
VTSGPPRAGAGHGAGGYGDPRAGGYGDRVRRALPAFFQPLEVAAVLPSTMLRAAELAAGGAGEGATVVADVQTAGRGRLNRTWSAPPGSSLLLTVVLRPSLAPAEAWLAAAAAGVALVDAVRVTLARAGALAAAARAPVGAGPGRQGAGTRVGLKWPNDLLLDGRKAAGLLAEARVRGGRVEWVLVGMGVNVGHGAADLPAGLAGRATSVALAAGGPVDRVDLLEAWAGPFLTRYRALAAGDTAAVLADYASRLDTLGREVRADLLGAGPVTGTAAGLGPTGGLLVRTAAREVVEVAAGDVEHLRTAESPSRG